MPLTSRQPTPIANRAEVTDEQSRAERDPAPRGPRERDPFPHGPREDAKTLQTPDGSAPNVLTEFVNFYLISTKSGRLLLALSF